MLCIVQLILITSLQLFFLLLCVTFNVFEKSSFLLQNLFKALRATKLNENEFLIENIETEE